MVPHIQVWLEGVSCVHHPIAFRVGESFVLGERALDLQESKRRVLLAVKSELKVLELLLLLSEFYARH